MVYKDGDIIDKEYKDLCAEMYSEGHSFFTYISDSADSLASCCYSKDTKVIVKDEKGAYLMSFEEVEKHNRNYTFRILNCGRWSKGKLVRLPNRKMYKVTTSNGKNMLVTDNHRNNCARGCVLTKDLTVNDYIMLNSSVLNTFPEKDKKLTYEMGVLIGAFLGDGSFGATVKLANGEEKIYDVNFSLSKNKMWLVDIINKALKQLKIKNVVKLSSIYNNVYPCRVSSNVLVEFISKWTNWYRGTKSANKTINMDCLLQSTEFREGILMGWYATDGNYNSLKASMSLRGYSTSYKLIECLDAISTSLGYVTSISVDDREEKPIFRGVEAKTSLPVYCLLQFKKNMQSKYAKDKMLFKDNSTFARIVSIEEVDYSDDVYCFEMKNKDDDKFTLANGIHNFNCRLKNELQENTFSPTTGLTGVMTGSCNVITLNINRIVQDFARQYVNVGNTLPSKEIQDTLKANYNGLKGYLASILKRVYKYHIAFKTMLYDQEDKSMFTACDAGYIHINKLYSTIGINGLNEASRFLGLDVSNNADYFDFLQLILGTIKAENKKNSVHDKKKPFLFNSEVVPAEGLGSKNYKWDRSEGYWTPDNENLYNSYFYEAHDNTSILDKFTLHGRKTYNYTDGGSALHCNLEDHLSKAQYLKLIDFAITNGTQYFTFNIPNTKCDDCGFIAKHFFDVCPKCGSHKVTPYTRVIGYLRPESAFDAERYKEAIRRVYTGKTQLVFKNKE